METQFDVIIVGAGPAGSAAALKLAQAGLRVIVFERGEYPGSKNVSGAAVYGTDMLEKLYPGFWADVPVERYITRKTLGFMTSKAMFSIDFKNDNFANPPYNGFSVLRPKFDRWLAKKAQEAGAMIVCETLVEGLVRKNGVVKGVRTGRKNGVVYADIVIAADGVNSFIAKEAGLQREFYTHEMSVGVKEIIALDQRVIEDRFQLNGNEGTAYEVVGDVTKNVNGGGFIYTNQKSISIGMITPISTLIEKRLKPHDLLEGFKSHPAIGPLVKDGIVKEYSAHMVPVGGYKLIPKLYDSGILITGDAASFVLLTGYLLLGINFAILSGFIAAETAIEAMKKRDFTAAGLSLYKQLLYDNKVLPTFDKFETHPGFLNNPRLQNEYGKYICGFMENLYKIDEHTTPKNLQLCLSEFIQSGLSLKVL